MAFTASKIAQAKAGVSIVTAAEAQQAKVLQAKIEADKIEAARKEAERLKAAAEKSILSSIGEAVSGDIKNALGNTPLAPFAGAVGSALQGDFRGAASNLAELGVKAVVEATGLDNVPFVGQLVQNQATSALKGVIGGQSPQQALKTAVVTAAKSIPSATAASLPVPPPFAVKPPQQVAPATKQAIAASDLKNQAAIKPYGKTFATRAAWAAWASDPRTCGGTVGFPSK